MVVKTWAEFYWRVCWNRRELEGNILHHAPFVGELAKYVKAGSCVLEIGTGTGVIGWPLTKAGVKVISLDNDKEVLEMAKINARTLGAEIEYVYGDALSLAYGDGEFDLVYSHGLVEHFDHEGFVKVINEHRRVGKMVVVGIPLKGCTEGDFGNERWMDLGEWEAEFKEHGFVKMFVYANEKMACFTLKGKE